jgi:ribosomal protein L37AE/L43A
MCLRIEVMTTPDDEVYNLFAELNEVSPCPQCGRGYLDYDPEFKAWVCDDCGLWIDKEPEQGLL